MRSGRRSRCARTRAGGRPRENRVLFLPHGGRVPRPAARPVRRAPSGEAAEGSGGPSGLATRVVRDRGRPRPRRDRVGRASTAGWTCRSRSRSSTRRRRRGRASRERREPASASPAPRSSATAPRSRRRGCCGRCCAPTSSGPRATPSPGAGSDLPALRTTAVRDGDHYVVNGQKVWSSSADIADILFTLVRTGPRRLRARRHHVPPGRRARAGCDGAPAARSDRRLRVLRDLLRRRRGARREPHR